MGVGWEFLQLGQAISKERLLQVLRGVGPQDCFHPVIPEKLWVVWNLRCWVLLALMTTFRSIPVFLAQAVLLNADCMRLPFCKLLHGRLASEMYIVCRFSFFWQALIALLGRTRDKQRNAKP